MRDFFMVTGLLLMIVTVLALYVIPPLVILVATFGWEGKWRKKAWLPVPIFAGGLWLSQTYGSSTPDLDAGEIWGIVIFGGAAILYYSRLFHLAYREQRAKLANSATPQS